MRLLSAIGRSRSKIIQAAISFFCPRFFLRSWLRCHLPADRVRPGTLYGLSLSFDVENEEDIRALPDLLALLREQRWTASFAVIGEYVQRYPQAHRLLADAGHELINHTHRHPWHAQLSPSRRFDRLVLSEMREEIILCHNAICEVCGVEPIIFRAPHFGETHTREVYPLLRELGYAASTSEVSIRSPYGGLPYMLAGPAAPLWEIPLSTCPDHPHAVLDTWHCLQKPRPWHAMPGQMVSALRTLLSIQRECGGYVNLYFDPAAFVNYPERNSVIAAIHAAGMLPCVYRNCIVSSS